MDHYYAFELRGDEPVPFYSRTFPNLGAVLQWVTRGSPKGHRRFYTVNCLPKRWWY